MSYQTYLEERSFSEQCIIERFHDKFYVYINSLLSKVHLKPYNKFKDRFFTFCKETEEWTRKEAPVMLEYGTKVFSDERKEMDVTQFVEYITFICLMGQDDQDMDYYKDYFEAEMATFREMLSLSTFAQ